MIYTLEDTWLHIDVESLFVHTIQEFFDAYIPSKKMQHLLIQNKWIRLDGNPVKREDDIVGLHLDICLYPETYSYEKVSNEPDIVYEDELLCIVNKPKDVLVHSDGNREVTLADMVKSHYADKNHIAAYPIHRLDKQTSGLVVFSKSIVFQPLLDQLLSEKKIRRNYLAFTEGRMKPGEIFSIDKPIGKDRHDPNKRIIHKNGQSALTKVRCVGCNASKNYSILYCTLDTGRTHQIRVHLSSIGHPILNDTLYGRESDLCIRMGLFAESVEFYHPLKEENMSVEAELPNDLNKLYLAGLR
ncbi:MAG: RluA family pseudouridine synthase [Erysipelotrichaceae bacterium]|nr:RluA family pseudouridine synthase [Erysipelotrichaceae bacterium]